MKKALLVFAFVIVLGIGIVVGRNHLPSSPDLEAASSDELVALDKQINERLNQEDYVLGCIPWCDSGVGKTLPEPNEYFGGGFSGSIEVRSNRDDWFDAMVSGIKIDEWKAYLTALKKLGYVDVESESDEYYSAKTDSGDEVRLFYWPNNDPLDSYYEDLKEMISQGRIDITGKEKEAEEIMARATQDPNVGKMWITIRLLSES